MKRLLPVLSLAMMFFAGSAVFGQSQRMMLVEEGTNASCGPCAAANPAFNALLDANETKTIAIKYQWYYPGYDPMNAQNPVEPAARMSYYGENGVPHARGDGNVFDNHPDYFTQTIINNEYAVPSPFDLSVTHTLSSDFDSIFIRVIIECTQAISGTLVAHTVIEEDYIHFASAPGGNGETEFFDVMRKMLPNQLGTTIATSWVVGQIDTLDFAVALPWYIYNVNELCVVAFIQDNANKNVKQAARSAPITQTGDASLDAGISALSVPVFLCDTIFTPTVVLKNFGSTVLSAATINWQIDNDSIYSQAWAGSLALNATANVVLPAVSIDAGTHTFRVFVSEPNGGVDFYLNNNLLSKTVIVVTSTTTAPLVEGFQTSVPPSGWIISNPGNDLTWVQYNTGGFGLSTKSAKLEFYNIGSGGIDEMILPAFDLSLDTANTLTFNVAYAQFSAENDRLRVYVSINCGSTWASVYNKAGSTLATAPAVGTGQFVPNATQWRTESVDLTPYSGDAKVFVKFSGTSAYGNNLYVDDINILTSTIGVNQIIKMESDVNIYPNPFTDQTSIDLSLGSSSVVEVSVYNSLGVLVHAENAGELPAGSHQLIFEGSNLPAGIYYINILLDDQVFTRKVSLIK